SPSSRPQLNDFETEELPMDPQEMIDTAATLNKRLERLAELRAKKEKDGLSRRDKAEIEKIRAEAQQLNKRLELDPRAFQPGTRSSRNEIAGDTLTREQRVADWLRERGEYRCGGCDRDESANHSL